MWPKRKTLLLVPPDREGWQGIVSLLNTLHREVCVRETNVKDQVEWAKETNSILNKELGEEIETGPTEILYWPGIFPEDPYRQWGLSQGLIQTELTDFLHRYWEEEIILPIPNQGEEEPFLWKLLDSAGFEPSLLWPAQEGQWEVRLGRGIHWIVPENWLVAYWGQEKFGRPLKPLYPDCCWVRGEGRVEFYADKDRVEYIGALDPYPEPAQENRIYTMVRQGLQLGVPWRSIRRVYQESIKNKESLPDPEISGARDNIRWYSNDLARDDRKGRIPIPAEEIEYLAHRGIG